MENQNQLEPGLTHSTEEETHDHHQENFYGATHASGGGASGGYGSFQPFEQRPEVLNVSESRDDRAQNRALPPRPRLVAVNDEFTRAPLSEDFKRGALLFGLLGTGSFSYVLLNRFQAFLRRRRIRNQSRAWLVRL